MRNGGIDKLDFDDNRIRPQSSLDGGSDASKPSGLLGDDESLLSDVVEGVIERDRMRMQVIVLKYLSFSVAVLNWWVLITRNYREKPERILTMWSLQSLCRLHHSLLPLRTTLPLPITVLPVPSQSRQHRRRNRHVPACTYIWVFNRPLQSTTGLASLRSILRRRISTRRSDMSSGAYNRRAGLAGRGYAARIHRRGLRDELDVPQCCDYLCEEFWKRQT